MLFQVLFSIFALGAVILSWKAGSAHRMSMRGRSVWAVLWILALGIVWVPESANYVANQLGIGRGADVIIYLTIPFLFFLIFKLHIKISELESHITTVVREQSIRNSKE
jgi:hypothetical protein